MIDFIEWFFFVLFVRSSFYLPPIMCHRPPRQHGPPPKQRGRCDLSSAKAGGPSHVSVPRGRALVWGSCHVGSTSAEVKDKDGGY